MAAEIRVVGDLRKVGRRLALLIPAAEAKKAGLEVGQRVEALVKPLAPSPFGLLKNLPYEPFVRERDRRDFD